MKFKEKFKLRYFLEEYLPFLGIVLITGIIYIVLLSQKDAYPHLSMTFVLWAACIVPPLLFLIFSIRLPVLLKVIYYVFAFFAIEIANVFNVFSLIRSYDTILHFISGPIISLFILCIFLRWGLDEKINIFYLMILLFLTNLGIGVIWEFTEYATDLLAFSNSQHNIEEGVLDTMKDLLVCAIGTLGLILIILLEKFLDKSRLINWFKKNLLQYSKRQSLSSLKNEDKSSEERESSM